MQSRLRLAQWLCVLLYTAAACLPKKNLGNASTATTDANRPAETQILLSAALFAGDPLPSAPQTQSAAADLRRNTFREENPLETLSQLASALEQNVAIMGAARKRLSEIESQLGTELSGFGGTLVRMSTSFDTSELERGFDEGRAQLAFVTGPELAGLLRKRGDVRVLAFMDSETGENGSLAHARSQLVVAKRAGVRSFGALRGKRVAIPRPTMNTILFVESLIREAQGGRLMHPFFGPEVDADEDTMLSALANGLLDAVILESRKYQALLRNQPAYESQLESLSISPASTTVSLITTRRSLSPESERFVSNLLRSSHASRLRFFVLGAVVLRANQVKAPEEADLQIARSSPVFAGDALHIRPKRFFQRPR